MFLEFAPDSAMVLIRHISKLINSIITPNVTNDTIQSIVVLCKKILIKLIIKAPKNRTKHILAILLNDRFDKYPYKAITPNNAADMPNDTINSLLSITKTIDDIISPIVIA